MGSDSAISFKKFRASFPLLTSYFNKSYVVINNRGIKSMKDLMCLNELKVI